MRVRGIVSVGADFWATMIRRGGCIHDCGSRDYVGD
jgi:hypothetical protein